MYSMVAQRYVCMLEVVKAEAPESQSFNNLCGLSNVCPAALELRPPGGGREGM